jgi:1-acyl-sn-glycerol-3-phosphate acyltransferase
MALIRSILFMVIFYTGSLPIVLSGFPAAPFGQRAVRAVVIVWAHWHRFCARYLLGITSRLSVAVPAGQYLVACKHQSMFETVEALIIFNHPVVVMKRELSEMPIWGWVARQYGVIGVDREGSASALRALMQDAKEAVKTGRSIVIFPEGTRVASGEQPALRAGFAAVAGGAERRKNLAAHIIDQTIGRGRLGLAPDLGAQAGPRRHRGGRASGDQRAGVVNRLYT